MIATTRRSLLAAGAAAAIAGPAAARPRAPGLAVTIDDFNLADTPLMTGAERHAAILRALAHHRIKAAGLVAGRYVDNAAAPPLLQAWSDAGHLIGNHTYSHPWCPKLSAEAFEAEIRRCEPLISAYGGFRRLFRFPYLAEGATAEERDRLRAVLDRLGYRNAHVTVDDSDWCIDNRLTARLKRDPAADLAPYRRFYLDHLWERATYYDGLARKLGNAGIDHTLLMHHRLTTGLFLSDALDMFRARGWRLADADRAFAQPLFAARSEALPAGQSLIWSLAKASGRFEGQLRYPGEDDTYENPKMDALGL